MNKQQHEIFKLRGIVTDISPSELMNGSEPEKGLRSNAVWTSGRNVHFDNGATTRVGGYARFADIELPVGAMPVYSFNVLTPDTSYWMWVDEQGADAVIRVTNGITHFDVTPVTPYTKNAGKWTHTILNGVPVLNNAIEAPLWWNGDVNAVMQTLPDWPVDTSCGSIRAFQNHLIAMDIIQNSIAIPNLVMWSDGADAGSIPIEWTPAPENEAGTALLGDTAGRVIDGGKLRDVFIIYKQHSTYTCQYVAGQFVFNFQPLFSTSGVQAVNCIVELKGRHWVFADDDIIMHDGNSYSSIVESKVRDLVFKAIDIQKNFLCTVVTDLPNDDIWFCLPELNETYNTLALVYSYETAEWGLRKLPNITSINSGIMPYLTPDLNWDDRPNTWQDDIHVWNEAQYSETDNQMVMSAPLNGRMYQVNASNDNDDQPVEAFIERRDWVIGGEDGMWTNIMTRAIYPNITGTPGDVVRVQIANTLVPNEAFVWQTTEDFIIPATGFDTIKIDTLAHGRYLNLRFSSLGGAPWQLHRIGVEYIMKSKF